MKQTEKKKMRPLIARRHQSFYFWTQQLVFCVTLSVLILSVSYLQKVECASLIPSHHLQQQQQQPQQQPQDFIIDDDGLVLLPLTPENNGLLHPIASNPNNHNMVTRFEG